MARQVSVATREFNAVREVARRFEAIRSDGKVDPSELEWVDEAIEASLDAADRMEVSVRLAVSAIETGMEGRRFKQTYREFTLIHGGLSVEVGPGAA